MASEIGIDLGPGLTGITAYGMLRNASQQVWNTAGSAFEAFNAANIADYDIAMTEQGSTGYFVGDMPAVAAGLYTLTVKQQAGGSPAVSDTRVGGGEGDWNGTAFQSVANISSRLPAALVSGRIDASVGAMAANTITAAATAADYITEVQTAITGGAYDLDTDANGRIRIVDGTGAGEINTTSGVVEARLANGVEHGGQYTRIWLDAYGSTAPFLITCGTPWINYAPAIQLIVGDGPAIQIETNGFTGAGVKFINNAISGKAIVCDGTNTDRFLSDLQGAWNAAWDAEVQSECADALTAYGASTLTAAGIRTAVGLASADLDTQLDALPTAVENADALLGRNAAGGSNGGKTVAFYVQGGLPKIEQNASGTSYTIYGADGTTVLSTGTIGRLATTVGGVEDVTPA